MITFILGILILVLGYAFYSKYIESLFSPDERKTPALEISDGVDFVPMGKNKNALIHLLNIAGMGPIIGAIQGILFGPIAFILIPLGCIFMGAVHDYSIGMLSMRNNGAQITGLIEKYLNKFAFKVFIVIVSIMLLLLATVFVYTSGDIFVERFFHIKDFVLDNPIVLGTYLTILAYFILATLFPIDKIIGKFYPILGALLIIGTGFILIGFFIKGVHLQNIDFKNLNQHPDNLAIIPMFFMTVSCGLLSGFHATQATIISRAVESEHHAKRIFYGMMTLESLIAIIWAAGAMDIYSLNLAPENIIGTVNVVNIIADKFVPLNLAYLVTIAVIILPITSGDTALRGLRITIADAINLPQKNIKNRFIIATPLILAVLGVLVWAKMNTGSFSLIWRYFTFFNQLIAIPCLFCATIYLKSKNKNYFVTFIPALFYVFITMSFILNAKIGFNINLKIAEIIALFLTALCAFYILKRKVED
ncbi:MAG: carbon starvation protein A [Candidatus Gastranaerophilales bacterium]|nr:carbon starvation protein A [Candidatus Gastranaerophilales bacterium]